MCNEAARIRSLGEISAEFNQLKIPLRFPEGLSNLGEAPSIRITDTTVIVRASRDGIVRAAADDPQSAEMVTRRWSWPGAGGKPVYNFRSEGRSFADRRGGAPGASAAATSATGGRCLIPIDAFFEFTDPGTVAAADAGAGSALSLPLHGQCAPPSPAKAGAGAGARAGAGVTRPRAAAKARKDKWAFTAADGRFLCVAGLWRAVAPTPGAAGEPGRGSEAFTMLTCAPGPDIAPYHTRQIVLLPRASWADWLGVGARGRVPAAELIAPTPAGTLVVTRAR